MNVADTPARRPRSRGLTAVFAGAGATSAVSAVHSPTLPLCLTAALVLTGLSLVIVLALLAVLSRRKYLREAAERILRLLLIDTRTLAWPADQQHVDGAAETSSGNG